jgi:hypothetical protein
MRRKEREKKIPEKPPRGRIGLFQKSTPQGAFGVVSILFSQGKLQSSAKSQYGSPYFH